MTIFAKVQNGVLTLPADIPPLPEGVEVQVILPEARPASVQPAAESKGNDPLKWMLEFAGCIDDLPEDFADEHNHYIHGTPRRKPKP